MLDGRVWLKYDMVYNNNTTRQFLREKNMQINIENWYPFSLQSEGKMLVQIFQIICVIIMAYLIDAPPSIAAVYIGTLIFRLFETHN